MIRLLTVTILSLFTISYGFKIEPRILNGIKSEQGAFPFYVMLYTRPTLCGATLLSNRWILTAAHCVFAGKNTTAYVGYGTLDEYEMTTIEPHHQHVYPGYVSDRLDHDIALMQLADDVELGAEVQPVKLSANCPPLRLNESVVFAGTGDFTIEDSAFNDIPILRQAYAKISPCDHWEKLIEQEVDQTTLICTDVIDDRGAYSGDSGGPLLRQEDGSLIGVMNFVNVKNGNLPKAVKLVDYQASAAVDFYYDWIANVTGLKMPKC